MMVNGLVKVHERTATWVRNVLTDKPSDGVAFHTGCIAGGVSELFQKNGASTVIYLVVRDQHLHRNKRPDSDLGVTTRAVSRLHFRRNSVWSYRVIGAHHKNSSSKDSKSMGVFVSYFHHLKP